MANTVLDRRLSQTRTGSSVSQARGAADPRASVEQVEAEDRSAPAPSRRRFRPARAGPRTVSRPTTSVQASVIELEQAGHGLDDRARRHRARDRNPSAIRFSIDARFGGPACDRVEIGEVECVQSQRRRGARGARAIGSEAACKTLRSRLIMIASAADGMDGRPSFRSMTGMTWKGIRTMASRNSVDDPGP